MSFDPTDTLIKVVRSGHVKIAKALIDTFGLSYSKEWSNGYILLCHALEREQPEMAKLLLINGAKVNGETRDFDTPLNYAVIYGYTDIVSMMLDRSVDLNQSILHSAVIGNSLAIVKLFLDRNVAIDFRTYLGVTLTIDALHRGKIEIVRELINHGVRMHNSEIAGWIDEDCTPFHLAVLREDESLVDLLLREGADINGQLSDGQTALHIAVLLNNEKLVSFLLNQGANVDAMGKCDRTALHFAAEFGYTELVKTLLSNKASIDALDRVLRTPLLLASSTGNLNVLKILLDNGANVNARDIEKTTPLSNACSLGNNAVVQLLLERNAYIDGENDGQDTPLYWAVLNDNSDVVATLIINGASIEAKYSRGGTALHIAAENKCLASAKILLLHGADVNAINDDSHTALDYVNDLLSHEVIAGTDDADNELEEFTDILDQNIIMMISRDVEVSKENREDIRYQYQRRNIQGDPWVEVANMKRQKIADTNVTFHDIVIANIHQLVSYARNWEIVETLETRKFVDDFPLCSRIITNNFKLGQKRNNLVNSSSDSIIGAFGFVWSNLFASKIVPYLSDDDLENLINANLSEELPK